MTTSEFYLACRNGDLKKVKQLLSHMTIEEIDRMELNGKYHVMETESIATF